MSPHAKSWLGIALNLATESGDLIDAFWWALPREFRAPPTWNAEQGRWIAPGMAQKAVDVFNHAEHVDGEKALKNFIQNQVGDFLGGKSGKATAKANRNLWDRFGGSGFGLGRGPVM